MTGHPPSGTVTFLLTDLEGSTRLWEQSPDAMQAAMARHDELLEKTIAAHRGYVFARMGDGMAASFSTARDAVCAAAAFQQALAAEPWGTAAPVAGQGRTAHRRGGDRRRHRLRQPADQPVLASDDRARMAGRPWSRVPARCSLRDQLPDGLELVDLGEHRLRDLGRPVRIFQLDRCRGSRGFPAAADLGLVPGKPSGASQFLYRA